MLNRAKVQGAFSTYRMLYLIDPKTYTADEKEDASLDNSLQLILVESLDSVMFTHVVNCKNAKHIWETIEIINEGTEEVRENRLQILTSQYEHFRSILSLLKGTDSEQILWRTVIATEISARVERKLDKEQKRAENKAKREKELDDRSLTHISSWNC
ncbi:hypothetical protein ACR2XN_28175 [Klebsiella pneumoniae]